MPLTLILGPANSAKAGEVLGAYAHAVAHRDALLVVPTAEDAAHYDRELAADGISLGRALTFGGLIGEIARRGGFAAPRLTVLQREHVLRRALARIELGALGESARTDGFPAAAGRLLAELARARVEPQRFAAAVRAWAGEDPERRAFAGDLAAIALGYARELDRTGRLDAERFAWGALDALRAHPDRWGRLPVLFYGFDDLTPVERDAVETLARVAGAPITVSLTYESGRTALAARARLAEELRAQADAVRELPSLDEHYGTEARIALHHLERGLFEPDPPRIDPGEAVVLMEAGGERAEAELVAAEVLAAIRAGVPPAEIVVVCRSLSRSGALLERVLRRYGVPAASGRTLPLGHTALGRALLALARCALRPDATAADLLAYLRAPGLCPAAELDALEAELRRRAVTGAADARRLCRRPLPEIDAVAAAEDLATELAQQTRRLLVAPHLRRAPALGPAEALDARAAAAALAALADLTELPGPPLGGEELLAALEGLSVAAADPPGPGAVLIEEPLAIRGRRFRRVLVTGLCEGEFPATTAEDPFLGEERRRELALAAGLVLPGEESDLARERYLLYACVSRATERLVLSYRSSDEDGNLVLPSPFLADIAELFVPAWRERRRRRLLAEVVWEPAQAPTFRERMLSDAAVGAACGLAPTTGAPETRRLGERAMAHVRHRDLLSGGALESFAACPVRWLVESQLQPEELEPEAEPLVKGSFMHDVLERVIRGLGGPVTPASLPDAERLLSEAVADPPAGLAPGRPSAVRAALLRGIEADLRRYLRHEAGDRCQWRPAGLERRFGFEADEESLPALELGEGEDRVRVRGIIDRIDVSPGSGDGPGARAIVRDYKSGFRIERAGGRWREEQQLQVGLYMLAVRRLLALEPVAGFYQPLTGRELRARGAYQAGAEVSSCAFPGDAFEAEELSELLADIEAQAVELARTLRRGELTPCPETCSRDGCLHPGICWGA